MKEMKLFTNGHVYTMDTAQPVAGAFVAVGRRFAYVGTDAGARAWTAARGAFEEVDLAGRAVIPGLNDSHLHLVHYAKSMSSVNLSGTKGVGEILARMREGLAKRAPNETSWLEGEGWNDDYFTDERRFPRAADLDEVSPDVPIMIMRTCYHVGVLNSAAMREIGLSRETAPSYGELVETYPDGRPNGVIKEKLLGDTKTAISRMTLPVMKELLAAAQTNALAQGLTSMQSDDINYTVNADYELLFRAFRELEEEGRLKIRVAEQCLIQDARRLEEFFDAGYGAGWGTDHFRLACIKLLCDGSLGARTAAMRRPYADDPGNEGILLFTQEELDELVSIAHRNACPTAIHAIGDRAAEVALNSIEKARRALPCDLRHGIVHCQITDRALLDRFAELDVLALVQPIFIDYDMNVVESRVGAELAGTSYAWKSMLSRGIHVSFGSDCPVEPFSTMPNIYAAVTRKNISGDRRAYLPGEAMSMHEALYAYTMGGAYATGEEDKKGSVTPGKLADFVVLGRDLFDLPDEEEILGTEVLETWVDGEIAYRR